MVLLRHRQGDTKVLVVHRPRHKDWSLPKGKLDRGENVVAAAVRECDEETGGGTHSRPSPRASGVSGHGSAEGGRLRRAEAGRDNGFTKNSEVDEIRWVTPAQAKNLLTYKRDYELVREATELPTSIPMIFLRHTAAMEARRLPRQERRRPASFRPGP